MPKAMPEIPDDGKSAAETTAAETVVPEAANAAVAEIIDTKKSASVQFNDKIYTFPRKRADARFRYLLQKNQDMIAFERLLGEEAFLEFLAGNEDDDGDVSFEVYGEFAVKVSEALGTGNS